MRLKTLERKFWYSMALPVWLGKAKASSPKTSGRYCDSASRRRVESSTEKHAELAVFAARANNGQSWVQAMTDYNKLHPKTAYHDSSDFRRQALDAYRRVMNMDLSWASARRQAD